MVLVIKFLAVLFLGGFISMFLIVPCLILWWVIAEACRFDRAMADSEKEEREPCDVLPLSLERRARMFVGEAPNRG